jgi:hemolysin activation/secretion protein
VRIGQGLANERPYGLRRARAAAAAGVAWLALAGLSQPPAAPPTTPPPPTRDEIRAPVRAPEPGRSRLEVEGGIPRAPCALDAPQYEAIRFTPSAVTFENLAGMAAADLRPAYAPYLGTEQPLSVICRIRDHAAAILRDAGYIAAVEVPEQRIEGGQIRLRVLMAKLVALRVRGDAGNNERLIASYLRHLTDQPVFNRYQAERYLLLASDLPGYNVRLALRPAGTVPGEVIGEVTVVRLPGQLDVNLQNFGSRAVGREGALVRGQLFGLTGMGDRTTLAVYTTADFREQQTVQTAHDFRIGSEGLQIAGQVTYAWARPDTGEPLIDIRSRTLFASLEASYPFVRTQRFTLVGGIGFDWSDQDVEFNGLPLSRDHLRTAFARLDMAAAAPVSAAERGLRLGPAWRLEGGVEVRQGLSIFGASEACGANFANCINPGDVPPSRLEGQPDATILRARASAEVRPIPNLSFFLGATAQYAFDPLLAFEEFSAGNYTVGRGYDPATLVGDKGVGLQAEIRFGRLDPQSPKDLAIQPYLFFDSAWVGNEDSLFVTPGRQDLHSAGAGIRAAFGDRVQLDATFAVPLVPTGLFDETPDPRFLISLTTRLWPWRSR